MFDLKGRSYLTGGKGGSSEEGGGGKDGEGAEGGAQSTVDGKCEGARVSKEGAVPFNDLVWEDD